MADFKIVEYTPSLAKGIAEMWQQSGENWGGSHTNITEESVLTNQATSTDWHVYLALVDDQVVGYCSLSDYREDEGSLYIPLLNVHPDYHGKKIGKALVTKVIERTIELQWPRLDLYTWSGNTKAVPLYKKCGFFWEKRDDTTHLMCLIPTVLQTEAVADFFKTSHWYDDAKREIQVIPDGYQENDFEFFEYRWEKDGRTLKMEFERKGRGLRLIETDDYLIRAQIERQGLVFGHSYTIAYEIINKSGQPLHITLKGKDDKNVTFDFDTTVDVVERKVIESSFFVGEVKEEPSLWRTHPTVGADLTINGKHALFKVGISPKFPAKLALKAPHPPYYRQTVNHMYIDIENQFTEETEFEFTLPFSEHLTFEKRSYRVQLQPKERKSIPVTFTLHDFTLYSAAMSITATLSSGETVCFTKEIDLLLKGQFGKFSGESEKKWIIANGPYSIELDKFNNNCLFRLGCNIDEEQPFFIYPKLGKPFSSEFSKKVPEQVETFPEDDSMVMKVYYRSGSFANLELICIFRLFASGIAQCYYEVVNHSETETPEEIYLGTGVVFRLSGVVAPSENTIVQLTNNLGNIPTYWDFTKLTENWLFSKGHQSSRGFVWPKDAEIYVSHRAFQVEHSLGFIPGQSRTSTRSIYLAENAFDQWQDFRKFALGDSKDHPLASDTFQFLVNDGNPFVRRKFDIQVREYKSINLEGVLTLSSENHSFVTLTKTLDKVDEKRETEFTVHLQEKPGYDLIQLDVNHPLVEFTRQSLIFPIQNHEIKYTTGVEAGRNILQVDNGTITLKAAPEFGDTLYSLQYQGHEWLDSSFPTAGPRSWFNPWLGGIGYDLRGLSKRSTQEEDRQGEFVQIKDNLSNPWVGIKLTTRIEKNEQYQGLTINQYYLTLPGIPLLCYTRELFQESNQYLDQMTFFTEFFCKTNANDQKNWMISADDLGRLIKYKSGQVELEIDTLQPLMYGTDDRQEKLLVFKGRQALTIGFGNQTDLAGFTIHELGLENGTSCFTPPIFYIFTDQYLSDKILEDLKRIRF